MANAPVMLSTTAWQRMASPGRCPGPTRFWNITAPPATRRSRVSKRRIASSATPTTRIVLNRQPTAFHADIAECAACHLEHQGRVPHTTKMDHAALARVGLRQLQNAAAADNRQRDALVAWVKDNARRTRRNFSARSRYSIARPATKPKTGIAASSAQTARNATAPRNGRFQNFATLLPSLSRARNAIKLRRAITWSTSR